MLKRITETRKRKILSVAAALFLCTVASAAAYWLLTNVIGEGEHSAKIGRAEKTTETVPLEVSFPEGMVPGKPIPLEVFVEKHKLKNPMEIHRAIVTFTNSAEPACSDSWFRLAHLTTKEAELFGGGLSKDIVYHPEEGEGFLTESGAEIELENNSEVLQGACESATLHVKVTTEP
jgi:hypothetical protein